jgi:hypothetical protein
MHGVYREPSNSRLLNLQVYLAAFTFSFLQNFFTLPTQVFWGLPLGIFPFVLAYQYAVNQIVDPNSDILKTLGHSVSLVTHLILYKFKQISYEFFFFFLFFFFYSVQLINLKHSAIPCKSDRLQKWIFALEADRWHWPSFQWQIRSL